MLFDLPASSAFRHRAALRGQSGRGEDPTLIFDLNPDYVREVLLPELLQRHLETGGTLEYQVEVFTRAASPARHLPIRSRGASG